MPSDTYRDYGGWAVNRTVRHVALFLLGTSFVAYGFATATMTLALVGALLCFAAVASPRLSEITLGGLTVELERARGEQDALVEDIRKIEGLPDFATLLDFNVRQMRVYQDLSTSQARSSYQRSQFAFGIGLMLIAAAVALAFLAEDTTTKLAASGVSGVGAALSAYISRTYLHVYERTLDQLNFYYRQPLVNSYLLTAERVIANNMSEAKRDSALDQLLEEILRSARVPYTPPDDVARTRRSAPAKGASEGDDD